MDKRRDRARKVFRIIFVLLLVGTSFAWSQTEKNWFAVVGSFRQLEEAEAFARRLTDQGYQPEIYKAENYYYAVTLGGYLELKEAKRLVELAKKEGIAHDAYVWRSTQWGTNLFSSSVRPRGLPPQRPSVWLSLEDIEQQLRPVWNVPELLYPQVSKTSSLSIFQPTITLSPQDQSLTLLFPFRYARSPDPYYQRSQSILEGKGMVEVSAEVQVRETQLVLGRVTLKSLEPSALPPDISDALQNTWLNTLHQRMEGSLLASSQVPITAFDVSFTGITWSQ